MSKKTDPTMGGLDALVAAASSVAGQGKNRVNRGITSDMIDPALQNSDSSDVADAMSSFLSNPAVVQLIAEYNAKKQHRHVSLYTQLLSGSAIPNNTPDTPIQQTRSGRISRPPVYQPPANPLQQFFDQSHNQDISHNLPPTSTSIAGDQTQLQAIKDALENVTASNETADAASYDALLQAVNNDSSSGSRFWRNNDLLPNWTGIEATTLAQAAETIIPQRNLGHGLPNGKPISDGSRKRSASLMESTGDESGDSPGGKRFRGEEGEGLPIWPLPPTGKGGRKNMPREELLARRRARNRVAAQESRKKKKEFFGTIADRLKDREQNYDQLHAHCRKLELEVEALQKVILGAGLELPADIPTPIDTLPGPSTLLPFTDDTPMSLDSITPGSDLPFHDIFTIDDNDADDLDFIPPSSPKRDSESEDSDDDEEDPLPKVKKGKRRQGQTKETTGDHALLAEDVEEDLFLPIEDVPVPPRDEEDQHKVMKQAMNELHVDTPQQLMGVIKKMVETAGYGGVTEEQVGMLSKLLALGQAQGMSVW
ncbi:uncharacterized protein IL334_004320 [Kwoniella shivajii]|uniref:BZIP domain-containing protein n=1 Tax=Kwoniella shivajii TaxID=564305 RepID=A0ABZ1D1C9_9TREE|nr:hypothetical protein IL334_004320 [Kwoniella shivajii]